MQDLNTRWNLSLTIHACTSCQAGQQLRSKTANYAGLTQLTVPKVFDPQCRRRGATVVVTQQHTLNLIATRCKKAHMHLLLQQWQWRSELQHYLLSA